MPASQPQVEQLAEQAQRWIGLRDFDPYDRSAREKLAEVLFKLYNDQYPVGTIDRGRLILQLLADSFATPTLVAAYFENLERLFEGKPRQPSPGQVILGLGSGRCGSTSLTGILATIEGSCATHENPPLIYWSPEKEQLQFHIRRFKFLAEFYPLLFDASHWWLKALDRFFAELPDGKAIGLHRDVKTCAQSFVRFKGQKWGSFNHWTPPANGIWRANFWDPTYPTYSLPKDANEDPDAARMRLIVRYIEQYNNELFAIGERLREKVMLVRTEELALPPVQEKIFEFVGFRGSVSRLVLNVGTGNDGADAYRL
jgi:hypothetical protein